jgi:GNAT superfamily N-acetyltransferase
MAQPNMLVACAGTDFQDWSALHALLVECFAYMEGRIDPPSSLTRMPPDVLAAKAREETLLVAVANGILIGCGYLSEQDDAIYIGKLAVAPPFRRRGVLRALIDEADKLARRRGKSFLELQTRVELVENHRTFEALGFAKVGETAHPGFDRATSITMRKRVPTERPAPDGRHNGGPLLDDHVPEWGRRGVSAYFTWKAARQKAFHASPGTVRRRALKAKACGLTYEEYTSFLLDAGRYLQPTNTDEINAIKSRRKR